MLEALQLSSQLDEQKRAVSYDAYDILVQQLVSMAESGVIDIAPDYQRHFIWDDERESELIESVFLGIPIPSLYMATNANGSWEVVDGVQRLSTLLHFCGSEKSYGLIKKSSPLRLGGLNKIPAFNGKRFSDLPDPIQLQFTLRPLRVTTLNDKSDFNVRYDLFERLNTGGVKLHPQEIRNCVYRGKLRSQLQQLANNQDFKSLVTLSANESQMAGYEECVLRFFAYFSGYEDFEHSVIGFLNDFMANRAKRGVTRAEIKLYEDTMALLAQHLPSGIARGTRKKTPINLYEAVVVGAALAIESGRKLVPSRLPQIINREDLKEMTVGATNNKPLVVGRIELVRDALYK